MKTTARSSFGAFHPAIFMLLVYVISLTMSIFVCRMVYYSTHSGGELLRADIPGKMMTATALK
jgi:hypothetical protein